MENKNKTNFNEADFNNNNRSNEDFELERRKLAMERVKNELGFEKWREKCRNVGNMVLKASELRSVEKYRPEKVRDKLVEINDLSTAAIELVNSIDSMDDSKEAQEKRAEYKKLIFEIKEKMARAEKMLFDRESSIETRRENSEVAVKYNAIKAENIAKAQAAEEARKKAEEERKARDAKVDEIIREVKNFSDEELAGPNDIEKDNEIKDAELPLLPVDLVNGDKKAYVGKHAEIESFDKIEDKTKGEVKVESKVESEDKDIADGAFDATPEEIESAKRFAGWNDLTFEQALEAERKASIGADNLVNGGEDMADPNENERKISFGEKCKARWEQLTKDIKSMLKSKQAKKALIASAVTGIGIGVGAGIYGKRNTKNNAQNQEKYTVTENGGLVFGAASASTEEKPSIFLAEEESEEKPSIFLTGADGEITPVVENTDSDEEYFGEGYDFVSNKMMGEIRAQAGKLENVKSYNSEDDPGIWHGDESTPHNVNNMSLYELGGSSVAESNETYANWAVANNNEMAVVEAINLDLFGLGGTSINAASDIVDELDKAGLLDQFRAVVANETAKMDATKMEMTNLPMGAVFYSEQRDYDGDVEVTSRTVDGSLNDRVLSRGAVLSDEQKMKIAKSYGVDENYAKSHDAMYVVRLACGQAGVAFVGKSEANTGVVYEEATDASTSNPEVTPEPEVTPVPEVTPAPKTAEQITESFRPMEEARDENGSVAEGGQEVLGVSNTVENGEKTQEQIRNEGIGITQAPSVENFNTESNETVNNMPDDEFMRFMEGFGA